MTTLTMAAKKTKRFSDYLPHPFSFNPSGHAVSLFLMGNLSSITCGFCEHTCMTTHKCPVGGGERSVGGGGVELQALHEFYSQFLTLPSGC